MVTGRSTVTLPLSQDFHSIQGEGSYAGAQMHFIRVSGCNVGVFPSDRIRQQASTNVELMVLQQKNPSHSICTSATGQQFLCDTEYNKVIGRVSAADVIEATPEDYLCITGGEPFLYQCLESFVAEVTWSDIKVHIETSGTLPISDFYEDEAWITCSPKAGFLMENRHKVNEFKFVVDRDPSPQMIQSIVDIVDGCEAEVFLQSVNWIDTVDSESTMALLTILKQHPSWRLSVQLHKILGVD